MLKLHKGEQTVLYELQQLRQDGKSYGDLVDWLNAKGIRTKNVGRWDRPIVYKILKKSRS